MNEGVYLHIKCLHSAGNCSVLRCYHLRIRWFSVQCYKNKQIMSGNIYHSSFSRFSSYRLYLSELEIILLNTEDLAILTGDLNISLLNNDENNDYLNLMYANGYYTSDYV